MNFSTALFASVAVALTLISNVANAGCTDNLTSDRELNIRPRPATDNNPIGRIPGEACGIRIRSCNDGWCRVNYRGIEGYSSEFYLQRAEGNERRTLARWLDVAGDIFTRLGRDPSWERIGALRVGRDRERDVIQLDRRDGRFEALRMRVRGAPVDFHRVEVVYGNGARDRLDLDRTIDRNDESGELALRGARGRFIDRIVLVTEKDRRRGPPAEVEVWARKAEEGPRGRQHVQLGPNWERLGSKEVDRRRERDEIQLSRRDGAFDALRVRVLDNDVRIRRMQVKYVNGVEHEVDVDRRIGEGELSEVIELRGKRGRVIDRVVLFYDTVGRGQKANVEIWGREPRRG